MPLVETLLGEITTFISGQALLVFFLFLVMFVFLIRIMNDNNPLEWWHFISSKGSDGKDYADIDKLGKVVGIFVSSVVILIITHYQKLDAMLLGVYLAYVGGVAGYSAYLRSKQPPDPP